jgi:cell division septum initiation protein DivIVA
MTDQSNNEAEEASSLLQMARKLHEQHVSSAREEANRILTQAHTEAELLVSNARGESNRLIATATDESNRLVHDSQVELQGLQRSIDEARRFESSYRASLQQYLTGLLGEIGADHQAAVVHSTPQIPVLPVAHAPEARSEEAYAPEEPVSSTPNVPSFQPESPAEEPSQDFEEASTFDNHNALGTENFDKVAAPATDQNPSFEADFEEQLATPSEDEYQAPAAVASDGGPLRPRGRRSNFVEPDFPSFSASPVTDDTVEGLLATEVEVHEATDAAETVNVVPTFGDPVNEENFDSMIESLSEIKGTEVDDDGGSSVENVEDFTNSDGPLEGAPEPILDPIEYAAAEVPEDAYQGHVEWDEPAEDYNAEAEAELKEIEAAEVDETPAPEASPENDEEPSRFEGDGNLESFDKLLAEANNPESGNDEKKPFSFFGKK